MCNNRPDYLDDPISLAQFTALQAMSEHDGSALDVLVYGLLGKDGLDLTKGDANELFAYFHGEHDFSQCNVRIENIEE